MTRGATPATALPITRALGFSPWRLTPAALASSNAQAPSLMPEAFPAVTVPPARNGVGSLASASRLVARGCSSLFTTTASPRFAGRDTATISAANNPAACAASARCWLRNANWSWSSREMAWSAATFSAVSGMDSTPNSRSSRGLAKRQPMVVSNICTSRANAVAPLEMT